MNVRLYNAAIMQLRAKAMESMALVDMYLTNPTMVPDHSSLVDEIVKHTRIMAEYEGAMLTLQQYFSPAPQKAPAPAPPPTEVSATPITEEELRKRSPTFRKSEQQKTRRAPKKTTKTTATGKE
jgi:hypothetical protein